MGYTKSTFRGITWISAFRIFSRLVSFLKIAVVARILSPAQFGVFGIATLALAFLEILTETGINIVLIQKKDDIHDYVDSAWVVSIIRGILLFILIIIFSPLVAYFFKSPDALGAIVLISFVPLIRGFINPAEVKLQKELKFKYEFIFRSSIFLIDSIISLILIVITHSVYSLIIGLLAGAIFEIIVSFVYLKPTPRFRIHGEYFREIFNKGKWITAYGIFNYLGENGDNVIVGRIMGAASLGIYQMAYKISILPISEISDVINKVIFPVYVKIENDRIRLKRAFLKTSAMIFALTIAVGTVIFLFPKEIILIVLGEKWITAVKVLQILSLYGVLRAITGSVSSLFLAVNKQNYVTVMTFLRCLMLILTIYPFVVHFGLIGAGYSALLSVIVEIPVVVYFSYKILK